MNKLNEIKRLIKLENLLDQFDNVKPDGVNIEINHPIKGTITNWDLKMHESLQSHVIDWIFEYKKKTQDKLDLLVNPPSLSLTKPKPKKDAPKKD